jgi:hypothetical protein
MRGIIFSCLLLAGCAGQTGIQTQIVEKPVIHTEKCVKAEEIPATPARLSDEAAPDNVETALAKALAKLSEWTRYGHVTDQILKKCIQ